MKEYASLFAEPKTLAARKPHKTERNKLFNLLKILNQFVNVNQNQYDFH